MAVSTAPRQRPRPLWSTPPTRSEPHLEDDRSVLVVESSLLLTVLTVAMVVVIAIVAFVGIRSIGGPSFPGTIEQLIPSGSSQVIVDVQVQNPGGSPVTPTCDVAVSSPAAAYTGAGTFTFDRPIAGGSTAEYSLLVPVTSDGATRVSFSASSVSCYL